MPWVRAYVQRADLALDAADAEAAGHADRVDVGEVPGGALLGLALVGGHPAEVHLGLVGEAAGAQRLGDREVGVGQVDVLADQRDGDLLGRVVHPAQQVVPLGPVDVAERQVRAGVRRRRRGPRGAAPSGCRRSTAASRALTTASLSTSHISEILRFIDVGDRPVGAADDGVRLDADGAQRGDRVLGRLGLQLAGRADVGHQRDVQEEHVVAADVVADLAGGLEERQRLDVADGAADLGDDHVDVGAGHRADPVLDLVGDVRDHLDGVAEVVAAALLGDHLGVDLAGGDVRDARRGRCRGTARSGRCRGRSRRRRW